MQDERENMSGFTHHAAEGGEFWMTSCQPASSAEGRCDIWGGGREGGGGVQPAIPPPSQPQIFRPL